MLLYMRDKERAYVFVLKDSQFDLNYLSAQGSLTGSPIYSIQFRKSPDDPHTGYLIVHTGGDKLFME